MNKEIYIVKINEHFIKNRNLKGANELDYFEEFAITRNVCDAMLMKKDKANKIAELSGGTVVKLTINNQ